MLCTHLIMEVIKRKHNLVGWTHFRNWEMLRGLCTWTLNKLQLRKLSQWSEWCLYSGLPANEFSSKYLDCIFFQPTICFQINPHCLVQMWYLEQFCYFVGRVYLSGEINVNCFSISIKCNSMNLENLNCGNVNILLGIDRDFWHRDVLDAFESMEDCIQDELSIPNCHMGKMHQLTFHTYEFWFFL